MLWFIASPSLTIIQRMAEDQAISCGHSACAVTCIPSVLPGAVLASTCVVGRETRIMKSFASPSFFRLFDLLLSATNAGLKFSRWKFDGVEFERERLSVMGPKHGLAIEIFTLTRAGRRGWTLMVTKEYWWTGEESKALKNLRWARATSGQRGDIFSWLRTQEAVLERSSSVEARN